MSSTTYATQGQTRTYATLFGLGFTGTRTYGDYGSLFIPAPTPTSPPTVPGSHGTPANATAHYVDLLPSPIPLHLGLLSQHIVQVIVPLHSAQPATSFFTLPIIPDIYNDTEDLALILSFIATLEGQQ